MGRESSAMKALGARIADAQDAELRALQEKTTAGRARFVALATAPKPARATKARVRVLLAVAAALALIAVALFFPKPLPAPTASRISGAPLAAGGWFGARSVTFSDGTRITLGPKGRARVAETTANGARVVLEQGSLDAAVVHREGTAWSFLAGPYEVRVTGTRFTVTWDPASQDLEIAMHDGAVLLLGPAMGAGLAVRGGETVRITAESAEERQEPPSGVDPGGAPSSPGAPPTPAPKGSASAGAAAEPGPTWQELAGAGKYREAMARIDEDGFSSVSARCDGKDLLLLADVARLSGRGDRASEALLSVRKRFAGASESATAAFLLGRLAFDGRHDLGEAERWFTIYLREQPGGDFASLAEGRLLEIAIQRGDHDRAQEAAKRYLERYPSGPHAAKARSVLTP
jgi:TolA-binding protein